MVITYGKKNEANVTATIPNLASKFLLFQNSTIDSAVSCPKILAANGSAHHKIPRYMSKR